MRKTLSILLFVVGCLFLVQAGIVVCQFRTEAGHKLAGADLQLGISIIEIKAANAIASLTGSLVGCFGMWLLALYLKVKDVADHIQKDEIGCGVVDQRELTTKQAEKKAPQNEDNSRSN